LRLMMELITMVDVFYFVACFVILNSALVFDLLFGVCTFLL
jgi:hypothetical protein